MQNMRSMTLEWRVWRLSASRWLLTIHGTAWPFAVVEACLVGCASNPPIRESRIGEGEKKKKKSIKAYVA